MSYLNMNKLLNLIKYFKLFISSSKNDPLFIIIYKKLIEKLENETALVLTRQLYHQNKLCFIIS